jgi:hypothetical protein
MKPFSETHEIFWTRRKLLSDGDGSLFHVDDSGFVGVFGACSILEKFHDSNRRLVPFTLSCAVGLSWA